MSEDLPEGLERSIEGYDGYERRVISAFLLRSGLVELVEDTEPETLEAIADEIDCFEHSARAASLRAMAFSLRSDLARLRGEGAGR